MNHEVISHYRLIEPIGRGAMGEVWLAEDTQLPRKVAVKLLPRHLSQDRDAVDRLGTRAGHPKHGLRHPDSDARRGRFASHREVRNTASNVFVVHRVKACVGRGMTPSGRLP
jgi:serine/threonine protein kinase